MPTASVYTSRCRNDIPFSSLCCRLPLPGISAPDRGQAYTLEVTSCNTTTGGTPNEPEHAVTFFFCEGGSYCAADFDVALPAGTRIAYGGATIQIPVETGFVPTTAVLEKAETSWDAW